jgi:hypothetical protein
VVRQAGSDAVEQLADDYRGRIARSFRSPSSDCGRRQAGADRAATLRREAASFIVI